MKKDDIIGFLSAIKELLINPGSYYRSFAQKQTDKSSFLSRFYLILGTISVIAFAVGLIKSSTLSPQTAIKYLLVEIIPIVFSLWAIPEVIKRLANKILKVEFSQDALFVLIGELLILQAIVGIVITIFPFLFLLSLVNIYFFYLLYVGLSVLFQQDISGNFKFMAATAALFLLTDGILSIALKSIIGIG